MGLPRPWFRRVSDLGPGWRWAGGSSAAVPFVALIAPVPTSAVRTENDLGEVLGVLVSQLHRRMKAGRGAVGRCERVAIHAIRDEGLRMHRALDVPPFVLAVAPRFFGVERSKVDEPRARLGPAGCSRRRNPTTV